MYNSVNKYTIQVQTTPQGVEVRVNDKINKRVQIVGDNITTAEREAYAEAFILMEFLQRLNPSAAFEVETFVE